MMSASMKTVLACVLFLSILSSLPSEAPAAVYVDMQARGQNDGTSWTDAYQSLEYALAQVGGTETPVTLYVAQGTYRPREAATFKLTADVTLIGGFAGVRADEANTRNIDVFPSILSGDLLNNDISVTARASVASGATAQSRLDNSRHILTLSNGRVVLDGFTITAGHAFSNGGRHATGSGAGINSAESHLTVRRCIFERNFAAEKGAAICVDGGLLVVEGSRFADNAARSGVAGEGGAIACRGADVMVVNTRFIANMATSGGAIYASDCPRVAISGCLFAGNTAFGMGAALSSVGSVLELDRCTLDENGPGDPLFLGGSSHRHTRLRMTGCIFMKGAASVSKSVDVEAEISYSNVFRSMIGDPCDTVVWGPGNINEDPLVARSGYWDPKGTPEDWQDDVWIAGDYHLKSQAGRWDPQAQAWVQDDVTSPCIDAGDPNSPIGLEPFPNGGRVNMGAYGGTAEASKSYFGEPVCKTIIAGDINGDCSVDWIDFEILARHWLEDRTAVQDLSLP
jgi:predicted outer membrane repeat protein